MATAYDVPSLSPLPGDAATLAEHAERYAGVADAIASVTAQLDLLVHDDVTIGDAADALRERTAAANAEIGVVLPRYRESAVAIREFATVLADAQRRANALIAEHGPLFDELIRLYSRRSQLELELQQANYEPDPAAAAAAVARPLNRVVADIAEGEARMTAIWLAYLDADADRASAGNAAAARIVAGALGSTDTPLDHLLAWWEDVTEIATLVSQWVREVLSNVLFYLAILNLAVVLLWIVGAAALLLVGSPLGPFLLSQILPALASGQLTPMELLEALFAATIAVVAPLTAFLHLLLQWEASAPTPEMRPVEPYWGTEVIKQDDSGNALGDYEHAMVTNNDLDHAGGMDSTVVEIVRIYDDAGNTIGWRVTLPSTQDWMLPINGSEFFEHGAANDLASNLMLVLSPEQQAAYERMVLAAMAQAGIGPDDPVMLVGFSQGGILAGKLASQDNGFNIQAIVTAGAPIDAYDIPEHISVLSMQHTNDIVARLDGAPPIHGDHWYTVDVDAPVDPVDKSQRPDHDGRAYELTAAATLDHPDTSNAVLMAIIEDQAMFFSDNEVAYRYEGAEDLVMMR